MKQFFKKSVLQGRFRQLAFTWGIIVMYLIVLIPQGCRLHTRGDINVAQDVKTLCSSTFLIQLSLDHHHTTKWPFRLTLGSAISTTSPSFKLCPGCTHFF